MFNYALFIKHPDPEYLIFNPEFVDVEAGFTGYSSAYPDATGLLGDELKLRKEQNLTLGDLGYHTDGTTVTIERKWVSLEAAQDWVDFVIQTHTNTNAPLPVEAKLVNLVTMEETILYPVSS